MRIAKKHDVRLQEILDYSSLLFDTKGYEETTVNDILDKVGIGKGTLYHYFASKEEIMNAIIARVVEQIAAAARAIADDETMGAHEKLLRMIGALNVSDSQAGLVDELHKPANALMHEASIRQTVLTVAPIMARVVEQGNSEGIYHAEYPLESTELLLLGSTFLFDTGVFRWSREELYSRMKAFGGIIEKVLGAPRGSFDMTGGQG